MTSKELVAKTIRGENTGPTPVYGWVGGNPGIAGEISAKYGSVAAFEDHYGYDMAHIFGGPNWIDGDKIKAVVAAEGEITPEALLDIPLLSPDNMEDYKDVIKGFAHHHERGRFCYIQTDGIFEALNGVFGIENHLLYLALYPEELKEVYARKAEWNIRFADHMIELGVDMIHISDDWGSQNNMMFSPQIFRDLIFPNHKKIADAVKAKGVFLSLHSDGNICSALPYLPEIGYDVVHPWQETAGLSYQDYLAHYSDKFGILGGLCIQSTLGFGNKKRLESEIRRVFGLLKGKRWMFCTTHFVQDHCSLDELEFAYDLAVKLARE
jgi:uroporphyrinogen decarboxylase